MLTMGPPTLTKTVTTPDPTSVTFATPVSKSPTRPISPPSPKPLPLLKIVLTTYALLTIVLLAIFFSPVLPSPWTYIISTLGLISSKEGNIVKPYECAQAHRYTTEIISVDPLLIYINDFVSVDETRGLIDEGTPNLEGSVIILPNGQKVPSTARTSHSAGLDPTSPLVQCILRRSTLFMGSLLPSSPTSSSSSPPSSTTPPQEIDTSAFSIPQIVQYHPSQQFTTHHDWYASPQKTKDGRWFNRIASFFVYLEGEEEGVKGGGTWFPFIDSPLREDSRWERRDAMPGKKGVGKGKARGKVVKGEWGEDGSMGTVFQPKRGNALFWVNLHGNGTGNEKTVHAGLPVLEGRKTAMNLWPRVFYERSTKGWWDFR